MADTSLHGRFLVHFVDVCVAYKKSLKHFSVLIVRTLSVGSTIPALENPLAHLVLVLRLD